MKHKRIDKSALDKCGIIIQARTSSSRFPKKMLEEVYGMPLIEYVYKRCGFSMISNVLVATSVDKTDDILYEHCRKNNINIIRGDLDNVLARYIQAAKALGAEYIIRLCGDTPLFDLFLMESVLVDLINEKLDYVSLDRTSCAACFYTEAVTLRALQNAAALTDEKSDLEHVTKFIVDNKSRFLTKFLDTGLNPKFLHDIKLTIDSPEDIDRVRDIIGLLGKKLDFTPQDIINAAKVKFAKVRK